LVEYSYNKLTVRWIPKEVSVFIDVQLEPICIDWYPVKRPAHSVHATILVHTNKSTNFEIANI